MVFAAAEDRAFVTEDHAFVAEHPAFAPAQVTFAPAQGRFVSERFVARSSPQRHEGTKQKGVHHGRTEKSGHRLREPQADHHQNHGDDEGDNDRRRVTSSDFEASRRFVERLEDGLRSVAGLVISMPTR